RHSGSPSRPTRRSSDRWLPVAPPAAPERMVLLQRIGDATATASPDTAHALRELTEQGTTSWMILASDDVDADHVRLRDAGVEIIDRKSTRLNSSHVSIS